MAQETREPCLSFIASNKCILGMKKYGNFSPVDCKVFELMTRNGIKFKKKLYL